MIQNTSAPPQHQAGAGVPSVDIIDRPGPTPSIEANAAVVAAAKAARAAGISVCPPAEDGTKRPMPGLPGVSSRFEWNPLRESPASDETFSRWYGDRTGVGFVCGSASAGLECFEFDDRPTYDRFRELAREVGLGDLVESVEAGYLESTPGGGVHWIYYTDEVRGNTDLAKRLALPGSKKKVDVLIQTRGEGGFVVVAPSFGKVHPSGRPYVLERGGVGSIVTLKGPDRIALWDLARSFDDMPKPMPVETAPARGKRGQSDELRPGDDFEQRRTWGSILEPAGWNPVFTRGDTTYWRRPGKSVGISATTNHHGSGFLWVFSSSTEFEAERSYTKFGAYAHLHHGSDHVAAAKALRDEGYGGRSTSTSRRPSKAGALDGHADGNGKATGPREEPAKGSASEDRPEIEINTERHRAVEESVQALTRDPNIYRRGESLVTVIQERDDELRLTGRSTLRGVIGSPKIVDLSDAVISCHLTRNAEFFQWKKDPRGEFISVKAHPPDWLIKAVSTRKHWPGIRELSAVVECPFPRPDGSIVETPGYDAKTATLYLPTIDFPKVPDKPTRDDARAAWARIRGYVRQFPFPSEDDCVVVLAGILNVIGRPAVRGPVPGTAVNGNRAGTGKGLLTDFMVMPGIGRPAPTSAYPDDKQEANKVKVSIVWSGKPVVCFDNLDEGSTYGGSAIDSMLTSITIDDRILGLSKNTGDIPVRVACFLNGNNLSPSKDAWRRWMVINLTTDLEHPERRNDIEDKSLRSMVLENRGEIVRDALIILKSHSLAGRPTPGWAPLGSFEEWDRVIRSAVWFATDRDCLATQRQTADDAPDRVAKIAVLEGWRELPGGRAGEAGLTSGEAVAMVEAPANSDRYRTMRGVLVQRGRGGKLAGSASLGIILRGLKNTPVGGLRLRDTGTKRHGAVCWVVESTREGEDQGTREDRFSPPRENFGSNSDAITCGDVCKRPEDGLDGPSLVPSSSPPPGSRRGGAMTAVAAGLLARARHLGVAVESNGARLRLRPPPDLDPHDWRGLVDGMAEFKADVREILDGAVAGGTWSSDDCPAWVDDPALVIDPAEWAVTVSELSRPAPVSP